MLAAIFILFYVYALLHLVTGIVQLKSKRIPIKNAVLFIAGGLVILLTAFFTGQPNVVIPLLGSGCILIQCAAVMNGFHLHGKITPSHQAGRFAFLVVLLVLYLIYM